MTVTALPWLQQALPSIAKGVSGLAVAELADERALGKGGFAVTSPAFESGAELDPCFTADEEDAVAPPLEWTAPPPLAQELVVIVEDPGAAGGEPTCHWLVWGLPGQRGKLLEGEVPPRVGKNSHGNSEWQLPQPPIEDGPHTYVFQLFALDLPLTLMPGASRAELIAAMRDHVVAFALLTATYDRQEREDDDWEEDDFE